MTFLFSFFLAFMCPGPGALAQGASSGPARLLHPLFVTADLCMACHNGLVSPSGEDVSIGADWRGSMMANAARDPYWHAAVRREVTDHPTARAAIENECAACHMPMDRFQAKAAGLQGEIFAHLPPGERTGPADLLAADGVSCTTCHQILPEGLGEKRSFTGGFAVDTGASPGQRKIFGSFEIDPGRSTIMRSASGFQPAQGMHIESSEMCATCHTLFTHALGPDGEVIGELAEQVPYLEWRHSAYRNEQSCQSCHMPVVEAAMPISAVLGEPREGFSRHVFRGGNFFIPRVFARFGGE
ncbi:MAG: hypothetical protein FJW35_18655, partial [Acidobacteria bacterium]|nr:hypothetical protein [Acidobacteriota bacterium]